jgi:hypothetical protein
MTRPLLVHERECNTTRTQPLTDKVARLIDGHGQRADDGLRVFDVEITLTVGSKLLVDSLRACQIEQWSRISKRACSWPPSMLTSFGDVPTCEGEKFASASHMSSWQLLSTQSRAQNRSRSDCKYDSGEYSTTPAR